MKKRDKIAQAKRALIKNGNGLYSLADCLRVTPPHKGDGGIATRRRPTSKRSRRWTYWCTLYRRLTGQEHAHRPTGFRQIQEEKR